MENCPKCNSLLQIRRSYLTFENDDTPDKPTIAYNNMEQICTNRECDYYFGGDMENPNHVFEPIKNRVN